MVVAMILTWVDQQMKAKRNQGVGMTGPVQQPAVAVHGTG